MQMSSLMQSQATSTIINQHQPTCFFVLLLSSINQCPHRFNGFWVSSAFCKAGLFFLRGGRTEFRRGGLENQVSRKLKKHQTTRPYTYILYHIMYIFYICYILYIYFIYYICYILYTISYIYIIIIIVIIIIIYILYLYLYIYIIYIYLYWLIIPDFFFPRGKICSWNSTRPCVATARTSPRAMRRSRSSWGTPGMPWRPGWICTIIRCDGENLWIYSGFIYGWKIYENMRF